MSRKPDDRIAPDMMDTWARLHRASGMVLFRVEARLKAEGFPPLGWYDVLLELKRADGFRLRPVDIEKRTLLAQYNVSRLIERLAAASYVEKQKAPDDGRGILVRLRPEGEALLKAMWPAYREAVETEFAAHLDKKDADVLWKLLGKLLP